MGDYTRLNASPLLPIALLVINLPIHVRIHPNSLFCIVGQLRFSFSLRAPERNFPVTAQDDFSKKYVYLLFFSFKWRFLVKFVLKEPYTIKIQQWILIRYRKNNIKMLLIRNMQTNDINYILISRGGTAVMRNLGNEWANEVWSQIVSNKEKVRELNIEIKGSFSEKIRL